MSLYHRIEKSLARRQQENALRHLHSGGTLTDFCSNDYLAITRNTALQQQIKDKLLQHEQLLGSGGSRLLSGNTPSHEAFERYCADYFKGESALLFNSGYTANLALFSTLPQKGDTILLDTHIHACIKEGAKLSFARKLSFKHNDLHDLEQKLSKAEGQCFIGIESIYSMDGDTAPIKDILTLANKYDACIIVDEAHSTGLYAEGRGWLAAHSLTNEPNILRIMTFGKAVGYHGAVAVVPSLVKQYLINFARPFIYTTAPPVHDTSILKAILDHIQTHPTLQDDLDQRIHWFKKAIGTKSISESAIQPIIIGGNDRTKNLAEKLTAAGFDVRPVLSPTVAKGAERLRICLHVHNTREEIDTLAAIITENT